MPVKFIMVVSEDTFQKGHDVKVADSMDAVKYSNNEERRKDNMMNGIPIDEFLAKFYQAASAVLEYRPVRFVHLSRLLCRP